MAEPPDDEEAVVAEPMVGGNLNTVDDEGVGLRRGGPSVGVVTLSDGLLGGV